LELTSISDLKPAPNITGIDNKNENLAASARFNFWPMPAIMVMPERETPGTKASAWAKPQTSDFRQSMSFISSVRFEYFSASQKSNATATSMKALMATADFPSCRLASMKSFNNATAMTAGTEPMMISQARR